MPVNTNTKDNRKSKRYYFTAPKQDVTINEWVQMQTNLSATMRLIISNAIIQYGLTDVSGRLAVMVPEETKVPHSHKSVEIINSADNFKNIDEYPAFIKTKAERDIYKKLYEELLTKVIST